jgi:hypothetical protein
MFHGITRPWFVLSCASLVLASLACTASQPADPLVGTWTMNPARSRFVPGPAPKSLTVTYEQTPRGLHVIAESVSSDGATSRSEYTAAYDGKDYPITGVPHVETVSLRRIDALTSERIDKRAGKQVQSYTRQVYADGRNMVVTQKGTDATGSPVDNTMVFEKTEKKSST